jgi:flagellar basal-body rod modification protein FlgD
MSSIQPNFLPAAGGGNTSAVTGNDLRSVDMDQFLNLMITELQNQDPLDPLDNAQFLQQLGQIRSIGSTNQLVETLQGVSLGQNLAMASSLIGNRISALDDAAVAVDGVVDRVSIEVDPTDQKNRTVKLHVGQQSVDINNVREILYRAE